MGETSLNVVKFEVLTAAVMNISVFWKICVQSFENQMRFRKKILFHLLGRLSSETSVDLRRATRRYIPLR
jgi:hypothetical protein